MPDLLRDQRWDPGSEAVEAKCLEELEHHQHERAGAVGAGRRSRPRLPGGLRLARRRGWRATGKRPATLVRDDPRLDHGRGDGLRLAQPPLLDQPAGAFRQAAPQEPDEQRRRPTRWPTTQRQPSTPNGAVGTSM